MKTTNIKRVDLDIHAERIVKKLAGWSNII